MNIRETDDDSREERQEIRRQRSNRDRWINAILGALALIATALGGTTYVQMSDVKTDPSARADSFTRSDGQRLRTDFEHQIAEKTAFNNARWDEIAKHLETQYSIMEALRSSVEQLVSKCAQGQARDDSMQAQISGLREEVRDDRRILYQHIGLQNGHQNGHQR